SHLRIAVEQRVLIERGHVGIVRPEARRGRHAAARVDPEQRVGAFDERLCGSRPQPRARRCTDGEGRNHAGRAREDAQDGRAADGLYTRVAGTKRSRPSDSDTPATQLNDVRGSKRAYGKFGHPYCSSAKKISRAGSMATRSTSRNDARKVSSSRYVPIL